MVVNLNRPGVYPSAVGLGCCGKSLTNEGMANLISLKKDDVHLTSTSGRCISSTHFDLKNFKLGG